MGFGVLGDLLSVEAGELTDLFSRGIFDGVLHVCLGCGTLRVTLTGIFELELLVLDLVTGGDGTSL